MINFGISNSYKNVYYKLFIKLNYYNRFIIYFLLLKYNRIDHSKFYKLICRFIS